MRLGYRLASIFLKALFRLIFGLKIYGAEQVPNRGRLLIACNHISKLDSPIVGASIPREVVYAAQKEIFKGLLGKVISYFNAIPVTRTGFDRSAINILTDKLIDDQAVLMFIQGGISRGDEVKRPKPGVGMLALKTNTDILPMRIIGSDRSERGWKETAKLFFRSGAIKIYFGNVISISSFEDLPSDSKESPRMIAEKVMSEINQLGEG